MDFNYAWNWICLTTVTSGNLKAVMYNFGLESRGNFKGFSPACQEGFRGNDHSCPVSALVPAPAYVPFFTEVSFVCVNWDASTF